MRHKQELSYAGHFFLERVDFHFYSEYSERILRRADRVRVSVKVVVCMDDEITLSFIYSFDFLLYLDTKF